MTTSPTFGARMSLPDLGHGIGLRRRHFDTIFTTKRQVDWLEIVPENYLAFGGRPRQVLRQAAERWQVVPHGVSLSVGGPDPLDTELLTGIRDLCRDVDAPWWSDHLCFSSVGGAAFHDLIPLPHSEEAVRHVAPRIREAADRVGRPMLIENISTYALMPGGTMSEPEFLTAVLDEADCGLLLDVNNVIVNAHNHGFDPYAYIDAIPLSRVVQLHLAGHRVEGELRIDDHGSPVPDAVWDLYEHVIRRVGSVTTLVEWDTEIPALDTLIDEADEARARAAKVWQRGAA